jgi:UDP-N-acetyl-2-amino-2-deoxyglucuronate dehydrogenase
MKRFAITGAAGYVAPRHLRAIAETGHRLVAVLDPRASRGLFDPSGGGVSISRDDAHFAESLARLRESENDAIDIVSVCSPSCHHHEHVRMALESGADVICEKPVTLDPRELDLLEALEERSGRRVWSVLQMRLHPAILRLAEALDGSPERMDHRVTLTYVTPRGRQYFESWKGDDRASGGLLVNIGIHFFDLLLWLFGPAVRYEIHERCSRRATGSLELARARVSWLLSVDESDLPQPSVAQPGSVYRSLVVDGEAVDFSSSAGDLHTRLYERVLEGRGFGISDARPSLVLAYRLRHAPLSRGALPHRVFRSGRAAG